MVSTSVERRLDIRSALTERGYRRWRVFRGRNPVAAVTDLGRLSRWLPLPARRAPVRSPRPSNSENL